MPTAVCQSGIIETHEVERVRVADGIEWRFVLTYCDGESGIRIHHHKGVEYGGLHKLPDLIMRHEHQAANAEAKSVRDAATRIVSVLRRMRDMTAWQAKR